MSTRPSVAAAMARASDPNPLASMPLLRREHDAQLELAEAMADVLSLLPKSQKLDFWLGDNSRVEVCSDGEGRDSSHEHGLGASYTAALKDLAIRMRRSR